MLRVQPPPASCAKEFIEGHPDVFTIEKTMVGRLAAEARKRGKA